MKIKEVEEVVTQTKKVWVSDDGEFESTDITEVKEYERGQALMHANFTFLYKTTTQGYSNSSAHFSEFYIYECYSVEDLKLAITEMLLEEDIYVSDGVIDRKAKAAFTNEVKYYAVREEDYNDAPSSITIKTLEEALKYVKESREAEERYLNKLIYNIDKMTEILTKEEN